MFKRFVAVSSLVLLVGALHLLAAPPALQGQCIECTGNNSCGLTPDGANGCVFFEVEGETYCGPSGGACGFEWAVSISGQVVVADFELLGAAEATTDDVVFDQASGLYRRGCDGAVLATLPQRTAANGSMSHRMIVIR